jgi:hypothetical protein
MGHRRRRLPLAELSLDHHGLLGQDLFGLAQQDKLEHQGLLEG